MDKLTRYLPDGTGINPSNTVLKEPHVLEDKRFKCMTLVHGSFFADSVKIFKYDDDYELVHQKDYVYADIDIESSSKYGQTVANVLIIVNINLGRKFKVDYQTVGLPIGAINERTVALLQAPETDIFSDSYLDIRNKPEAFDPTFHFHHLSEIQKFEAMLFFLEKIRIAIIQETSVPIKYYIGVIEDMLQSLLEKADSVFTATFEIELHNFKEAFNRLTFNVDKLQNLAPLKNSVAQKIAKLEDVSKEDDGYLTLQSLLSFKNIIYERYLAADYTTLGSHLGLVVPAYLETLAQLRVGSTVIFDSFANNNRKGLAFDRLAYPDVKRSNSKFVYKKIAFNVSGNVSILFAIEVLTSRVFTGKITRTNVGLLSEWKEVKKPGNILNTIDLVGKHLSNLDNPHRDSKEHVELSNVENLPLADTLEILTDANVRKYVTWAQLDSFIKRFLLKRRPQKTEQLVTKEENLMRNVSVVFSNCGMGCSTSECRTIENPTPVTTTPAPLEVIWTADTDKTDVRENETITFTVSAANLTEARTFYWFLEGEGLLATNFVGNTINGNSELTPTAASKTITVTLKSSAEIESLKDIRMVVRETGASGPIKATSTIINAGVIVFNADYFIIEYLFTDGLDLDTRTQVVSSTQSNMVGWCKERTWPPDGTEIGQGLPGNTDKIMIWGGDNTGTGTETVLFKINRFRFIYPLVTNISIQCNAFWYTTKGNNPVGIKVTMYQGGTPVLSNFHWSVPNAANSRQAVSTTKLVNDVTTTCGDGEEIAFITLDLITNTWTIS